MSEEKQASQGVQCEALVFRMNRLHNLSGLVGSIFLTLALICSEACWPKYKQLFIVLSLASSIVVDLAWIKLVDEWDDPRRT